MKINASSHHKIVKELINRRVKELGRYLGTDIDLDSLNGESMRQQMTRYKKLLKEKFNMSVEEASKVLQEGFDKQRAQFRGGRQFARNSR